MRASSLRRNTWLTALAICPGLGGGCCSNRLNTSCSCVTVNAGVFFPQLPPLQRQEPQRQQRQRHVVVPADPTPHLVVAQPDFALAFLQDFLYPVPLALHPRQYRQAFLAARVAHCVPGPRL